MYACAPEHILVAAVTTAVAVAKYSQRRRRLALRPEVRQTYQKTTIQIKTNQERFV